MKYIILLLFLTSCGFQKQIVVTDLNTTGVVVRSKKCKNCVGGNYLYKIKVSPEFKIKYISYDFYNIGDELYIQNNIIKDK